MNTISVAPYCYVARFALPKCVGRDGLTSGTAKEWADAFAKASDRIDRGEKIIENLGITAEMLDYLIKLDLFANYHEMRKCLIELRDRLNKYEEVSCGREVA